MPWFVACFLGGIAAAVLVYYATAPGSGAQALSLRRRHRPD
jgi:hypothetical protein